MRILMDMNGKINPRNIDDYIVQGGYTALAKALFEMEPEEIIEEVDQGRPAGKGRGGFSDREQVEVLPQGAGPGRHQVRPVQRRRR